jgi:acyl-homoserine-lactone acylase
MFFMNRSAISFYVACLVRMETLHPFGASTRPDSPHYTDQMQLYADQKTKPMTLDKAKIMSEAKSIYHPH